MLLKRDEQVGVSVTADRLAGRFERGRLDSGERVGLGNIEDGSKFEANELRFAFLGVRLVGVSLSIADWREDPDRLLTLADTAAELEPLAEPGDVRRVGALERDQERIAKRVAVEARACTKPALPTLAGEQSARRLTQLLKLLASACIALFGGRASR